MPAILVFLKAPVAGKVKTRLAHSVGDAEALTTYCSLVKRQLRAIPKVYAVEIRFTPATHEGAMRKWLGDTFEYYPQCEGDLSDRLTAAVADSFKRGSEMVFCIGGDCPQLNAPHLKEASTLLKNDTDIVFGPTEDGGYYLVGMRARHTGVFAGIPWSCADTLAESIKQAEALGLTVHLLETLYDVDTNQELERARAEGLI